MEGKPAWKMKAVVTMMTKMIKMTVDPLSSWLVMKMVYSKSFLCSIGLTVMATILVVAFNEKVFAVFRLKYVPCMFH